MRAPRPAARPRTSLELADVELVALDTDADAPRARVRENLERLHLGGPPCARGRGRRRDAAQWWDGRPFDRILADVPCTASPASSAAIPTSNGCGAKSTSRGFALQQARLLDALVGVPGPRRPPVVCDLLGLRRRKRSTGGRIRRATRRRRCAKPSFSPPRWPVVARNSCLRSPARATIRTHFSTRCCASPDGAAATRVPPAPTPTDPRPRVRRPARRHAPSASLLLSPARPRRRSARLAHAAGTPVAPARRCTMAGRRLGAARHRPVHAFPGGARRHDCRQGRRNCAPTTTPTCSMRSSTSRSTRRWRRRCRRASRSTSCLSSSCCGRAGTGWTRRCLTFSTQYRVSYNALTRQYRVATGLLGPDLRLAGRGRAVPVPRQSRQVATLDQFDEGRPPRCGRYGFGSTSNALPKPFQLSALASREWSLQSDWHRWSFTP